MFKFVFLIFISFPVFSSVELEREKALICVQKYIPSAQKWIDEQTYNGYDKFKHCAVSCYLSLRCSRPQVRMVGVLKEVYDMFGPGHAEIADIKADFYGVRLVKKEIAHDDDDCAEFCDERFHQ
jgi:hypothetical protein